MIEIRIRHEDEATAVRLMDWPSTDLDGVLRALKGWGVVTDYGEYHEDLSAQFVARDGQAYFEIVILGGEES